MGVLVKVLIIFLFTILLTTLSFFLGLKIMVGQPMCIVAENCPSGGLFMPDPFFIPLWILLAGIIFYLYQKFQR